MSTYTLKKEGENDIIVLNASNERVSSTQLLADCGESRVIALDAPMGTGKTTLIKQLMKDMGSDDVVNSPTFAIVNVYEVESQKSKVKSEVYHFDCYRLKNLREAIDFGAEEYLYSGNWCMVEWPEIIEVILPEDTVRWKIRTTDNGDRILTIE